MAPVASEAAGPREPETSCTAEPVGSAFGCGCLAHSAEPLSGCVSAAGPQLPEDACPCLPTEKLATSSKSTLHISDVKLCVHTVVL